MRQSDVQQAIHEVCTDMAMFLIEKNTSYGNSALDPVRIFSRASPVEQLNVRIDDKISRKMRGDEYAGDDDEKDLVGYLLLKMVERRLRG